MRDVERAREIYQASSRDPEPSTDPEGREGLAVETLPHTTAIPTELALNGLSRGVLTRATATASLATRTAVNTTRNVLSRLGAERAIELVSEGKAGGLTGSAYLDRGLARLGHLSKGTGARFSLSSEGSGA